MKTVLFTVCLSLVAVQAHAISRYNPTQMSCDRVQSTVDRQGAVILRYTSPRSGVPLYDRYVRDSRFCPNGQIRNQVFVPSADIKSCPVYNCKEQERDRRFPWLLDD
ncbi:MULTISPECIES: hypothetical protein [unclassified Mesorhizobium]|uniref:hypothetical protein n=1 Tax=unclassified Mesorhizobium TaxID=325217 RepID=UPI0007020E4F|nr:MULTISPECIES: hypothetical protein [unclassified Mesorhizobium]KQZ14199.1 hypothetical protein ASD27_09060 [Mesorhizobium sp. Root1471]KQZ36711.1 hypothetical protein ASD44_09050 [Mesorhizobium sp. Root554]MDR7034873.1 hypothetical protein [Mesorhizobium sp. BE184]